MSRKIYYINFYSSDFQCDYISYPSGWPKIEYITSILKDKYQIEIVAPIEKKNTGFLWFKKKTLSSSIRLTHFPTFRIGKLNGVDMYLRKISLFFYLFFNLRKEDTVLIYHSMFYLWVVKILRFFKKNTFILQVEELYYSLNKKNSAFRNEELRYAKSFKKIIAVSDLIKNKLSSPEKEIIIAYGDYRTVDTSKSDNKDSVTKVIYAGTIEQARQAAFVAAKSAEFLPVNYLIQIAGFGSDEDVKTLLKLIEKINQKYSQKRVEFLGFLSGEAYRKALLNADIGLSCHVYTEDELVSADNTFPSKLIVYLKHNLSVVCNDIKCVRNSALSENISFFKNSIPEEIAKSILSAKKEQNNKYLIENLDEKFHNELVELIEKINEQASL